MSVITLKLNTIELPVQNLDRALAWYDAALKMKCVWSDDSHALLEGDFGARFLLVKTTDPIRLVFSNNQTGVRHSVVDFETDDLEAFHAALSAAGLEVAPLGPPPNDWAPRGFPFLDTEGNCFGVYTYGKPLERRRS